MRLDKTKDYILFSLRSKNVSLMEWVGNNVYSEEELEIAIEDLESEDFIDCWAEDGWGTYMITNKGKLFIEGSTFEEIENHKSNLAQDELKKSKLREERHEIEFNWKKRDEKRKNTTLVYGFIAAILGLYSVYNQKINTESTHKINARIDSINAIVSLSKLNIDSLSNITNSNKTKKDTLDPTKKVNTPAPISIIK